MTTDTGAESPTSATREPPGGAAPLPDLTWRATGDGGFVAPASDWTDFTGQPPHEAAGAGWLDAVHPHDRPRTVSAWRRAQAARTPFTLEHRLRGRDGEYRWFLARAVPVFGDDGAVAGWAGTHVDLTGRLGGEARGAGRQLRVVLDSIPQLVWTTTAEGYHEYYNARWYEYTGLTFQETRGEGWNAVLHPDDRERAGERWRHSLSTGDPYSIEYRFRRHDGVYRWFLGQALPQYGPDGQLVRWFGTCTDVDDQKRAEAERDALILELAAERGRLREVFTQAPALMMVMRGPDLVVQLANPPYRALFGHRELEGLPLRRAVPELEGQGFFELLERVYATGEPSSGTEVRAMVDRGSGVPEEGFFNFVYAPMRDGEGQVVGVLVHAVEVTAQVVARRSVERLEERVRMALEAADIGTWDLRLATGELAWDARCRQIFGLAPGDPVDYATFLERLHPDDRARVAGDVERALDPAGDGIYEVDYRLVRPDGCVRWARARGRGFFEGHGPERHAVRFTGTVIDVTEQKLAEEERERAVSARSRFYATMSHELRTPINAVLGYNDLLLAGVYGDMAPRQKESVERGQRAARHLLHLVNDVLDLSKLEAGKMEMVWEPVPIVPLVGDLFATVRPMAEEHGSELRLDGRDAGGVEIVTDPRRVQQILLNLISNALKFGEGKPVDVRCAATDDFVTIEVRDHGRGIPPEDVGRIFEEFVQLPNAGSGGTGLGLPISQRLARLLGGRLEVDSQVGEGSTFCLVLPRRAQVELPQAVLRRSEGEPAGG